MALLLSAISGPAAAQEFTVPPPPKQHVTDAAGALSPKTRSQLEAQLQSYEKSTGHQVIVWIGDTTAGVPLETWTAQTAHTWKIGRRGRDDGVILFVFMRDRKIRIEVGYGLEGVLTDAASKRIIQTTIVPNMRAGTVDRAVTHGVRAILATITPAFSTSRLTAPAPQASAQPLGLSLALGLLLIVCASVFASQILRLVWFAVLAALHGQKNANASMDDSWWRFVGGGIGGGGGSEASDDDGMFSGVGDDFDAGGGDFGGGGASGSW